MKANNLIIFLILLAFFSCNTDENTIMEDEPEIIQEQEDNEEPVQEEPIEQVQPVQEEPEEFIITEEIYEETFNDINEVINELNIIIQRKDYDAWLMYLTDNYINETSKPSYLEKWDNDKNLQQRNIVIRSLRDYFDYLVVPRRSEVQLDEIEFKEQNRVYAYTVINGVQYLLYNLVRTEKGWKIDFY